MKELAIKYMIGVFTNTDDLKPNAKVFAKLYEILGDDYLSVTIQEMTPTGPQNSIAMENQQTGLKVLFLMNRILIEKVPSSAENSLNNINEFVDEAVAIASSLLDTFDKKANRMSLVSKHLVKDLSNIDSISEKLFQFPMGYSSDNTFEWNWRLVRKEEKNIANEKETLNYITMVNRIQGKLSDTNGEEDFEGLDIEFDINTEHENDSYRFDKTNIQTFYNEIKGLYDEHNTNIHNFLLGSKE